MRRAERCEIFLNRDIEMAQINILGCQGPGPLGTRDGGNFSPCPPLSVYSLKKAPVKIAENHVNLREDSSPFFPILFSMKFDKLSAYNRYFAGRLVSIFQVLIAFKFELAAYYKKLFLAGKQYLFLRMFSFLLFLFSY